MPDKHDVNTEHEDVHEHEVAHHNETNPFRIFWIILGVILGIAILWILFSYIYLAVTHKNTTPNNNNQNQTQPTNPEVPTTPTPQNSPTTPTPQTQ